MRTFGCLFLVAILPGVAWAVWYVGFAEHSDFPIQSTSPDGGFRCTIREWSGGIFSEKGMSIQREAVIERKDPLGIWRHIGREQVDGSDSVGTTNYSITWEFDKKNDSIRLTVIVDGNVGLKYNRSW
jgi:hypothetical protein